MGFNRLSRPDPTIIYDAESPGRAVEVDQLLTATKNLLLPLIEAADQQNDEHGNSPTQDDFVSSNALGYVGSHASFFSSFKTDYPTQGGKVEAIEAEIRQILAHSVNGNSRGFLDKLYSSPSPPGIAAEMLLSMINNNGHVWHVSPALSTIEKRTALALAHRFGLTGEDAGGVTMPGGAASNTTALLIARNIVLPMTKLAGTGCQQGAVYVSEAAHYSIANAAQFIGLGTNNVYQIPTMSDGRMDPSQLREAIQQSRIKGQTPMCVIATAGTTVKGAFDPLRELGQIAREENAWFHVDACWGGAAIFSDELKSRLDGTDMADSISFNPHKMLGVPLVCSFLLARDLRTFWCANKLTAGYLFHNHSDEEEAEAGPTLDGQPEVGSRELPSKLAVKQPPPCEWRSAPAILKAPHAADILDLAALTPQCGRRPDAVKLYLHWNYYGLEGMAKSVETAVHSAQYLSGLVAKDSNLRLLDSSEVPFAQVCFYIVPAKDDQGIYIRSKEAELNTKRTRAMSAALRKRGWMVDFAPGTERHEELGHFMRVVCHRETTTDVVDRLYEAISLEAEQVREIF